MTKNVVALVGQNANDILSVVSKKIMQSLKIEGISHHVIDLNVPGFQKKLQNLVEDGILFAWGPAGFGSNIPLGGESLWDKIGIPFISVHADPPFANPRNHCVPARNVINAYHYKEGADFQRDWICSSQISAMIPLGILPITERDVIPWSKRPRRMVFVKSGNDPAAWRARWSEWPTKLRRVLNDSADAISKEKTGDIVPISLSCLDAHGIKLDGRKEILCGLLQEVDIYIRSLRATTMAMAVRNLPIDIVGDGWGHVSHLGGQARFLPPINASGLDGLYAETQYLMNANPNFSSGLHERVLYGFAAKCCVVSDDNAFSRANLAHLPSYHGVEWNDEGLADKLSEIYSSPSEYDDQLQPALDYVHNNHSPAAFFSSIIEFAEIIRTSRVFKHYAF